MNAFKKTTRPATVGIVLLLLFVLLGNLGTPSYCHAAAKKRTFYASAMSGTRQGVKKIRVTDDGKIIIWARFGIGSKADKAYQKYADGEGEYQKYVFPMGKHMKFYATGGIDTPKEYSLEVFKVNYAPNPDLGLGLLLKVKNGKLVALYTES